MDLAEILVLEGVPFREAHEAVGRIVGHCEREAVGLSSFTREQMQEFHSAFPDASANLLDLEGSLAKRDLVGGTSRKRVSEALDTATRELEEEARVLEDAGQHIEGSK